MFRIVKWARRPAATMLVSTLAAVTCIGAAVDDDYSQWEAEQALIADNAESPLDRSYDEWEQWQAQLADQDMSRRMRADQATRERLALNSEYARWEDNKHTRANQELERKADLRESAADLLAVAEENARIALANRDAAIDADRHAAEQAANDAEAERLAAERNLAAIDDEIERARQDALDEARASNENEQALIAERYATTEQQLLNGHLVSMIPEKVVYLTVDVSVRTGPSNDYEVVGTLKAGGAVTVDGSTAQWWHTTEGRYIPQRYTTDTPPEGSAAARLPLAENSPYRWSTWVANANGQGAVDACLGGVTHNSEVSNYLGRPYYPIHNHCAGAPILSLTEDDLVFIEGVGVFKVVAARDVVLGDSAAVIKDVSGDILLQTCYAASTSMRVVGLNRV